VFIKQKQHQTLKKYNQTNKEKEEISFI